MGKKGGSPKIEVTKYRMSEHLGVCIGPVDEILAITVKEKEAWSGSQTSNGSITIDNEELFGGLKKEGGLQGTAYCLFGESDQILPDELAVKLGRADGADCPGFRGITSIFFSGDEIPDPDPGPVFEGWYMKWRVEFMNASVPVPGLGYFIHVNNNVSPFNPNPSWAPPDTTNEYEIVNYSHIEWRSTSPADLMNPNLDVHLRLQFTAGTVSSSMRARFLAGRWNSSLVPYSPEAGSWSMDEGGGWFDVRGTWPDDWYFTV